MPYAENSGVKIHYHVEGDGPPLVLQHGLTSSLKNWYAYGFVEELQKDYRLILVDARGHGRSDKPHDPKDYDLKLRVNDVLAVMDELGVGKAHYRRCIRVFSRFKSRPDFEGRGTGATPGDRFLEEGGH